MLPSMSTQIPTASPSLPTMANPTLLNLPSGRDLSTRQISIQITGVLSEVFQRLSLSHVIETRLKGTNHIEPSCHRMCLRTFMKCVTTQGAYLFSLKRARLPSLRPTPWHARAPKSRHLAAYSSNCRNDVRSSPRRLAFTHCRASALEKQAVTWKPAM